MLQTLKLALAVAAAAAVTGGVAQAGTDLTSYDIAAAPTWAEKLALCDTTAFLTGEPNLNANIIFVRRDDAREFDMLLPPTFVGGGQWYSDGYERLYRRLRHAKKVTSKAMWAAQAEIAHDFVEAYRRSAHSGDQRRFLREQDSACKAMARAEGVIVS
jgi:hypothetical protein